MIVWLGLVVVVVVGVALVGRKAARAPRATFQGDGLALPPARRAGDLRRFSSRGGM